MPAAALAIGGAAVLTTLDAEGLTERVIHRWDGKLGESVRSGK